MTDMTIRLGGIIIPKPSTFKKTETHNGKTITTLGNNVYTDFTNYSRSWEIGWQNMYYEDYVKIRTLFFNQRTNGYPYLSFDAYGIYTQVKLDISQAQLALNGVIVQGFTMTMREATAVS